MPRAKNSKKARSRDCLNGFLSLVSGLCAMTATIGTTQVQAGDGKEATVHYSAVFNFTTIDDFATVTIGDHMRLDSHLVGTHSSKSGSVIKDITMYLTPGENKVKVVATNSQHGGGQLIGNLLVDGEAFRTYDHRTHKKGNTSDKQLAKTDDSGVFFDETLILKGKPIPVGENVTLSFAVIDDDLTATFNDSDDDEKGAFSLKSVGTSPNNKGPVVKDFTKYLKAGHNKIVLVGKNGEHGGGQLVGKLIVDGRPVYNFSEGTHDQGEFGYLEFHFDYDKQFSFAQGTTFLPDQEHEKGRYYLMLQKDGNFVLRTVGNDAYQCGIQQVIPALLTKIAKFVFQSDGNLVAYDAKGNYVWSVLPRNTDNTGGKLAIDHGRLRVLNTKGDTLWACKGERNKSLFYTEPFTFQKGKRYDDGLHYISLQEDGNFLVKKVSDEYVYGLDKVAPRKFFKTDKVVFQDDGDLVAFDKDGNKIWAALEKSNKGGKLVLKGNGDLVLLDAQGNQKWSLKK